MSIDEAIGQARQAYMNADYVGALTLLNNLLDSKSDARPRMLVGEVLMKLGMPGDALEAFEQAALVEGPLLPVCLWRAALVSLETGDIDKAQHYGLRLREIRPDDPELAAFLARLFLQRGEHDLVDVVKDTLAGSEETETLRLAARLIGDDPRNPRNLEVFGKLRARFPADDYTRFTLLGFAREFCDFERIEQEEALIRADLAAGRTGILQAETPHMALMWSGDEAINRLAVNQQQPAVIDPTRQRHRRYTPHVFAEKIRVGYVSADLWDDHATMRLLQSVLMAHDPDRFEITLFCITPPRFLAMDGGNRKRWGRIVTLSDLDDAAAVAEIRAAGIDILVDLKGNTASSRPALFNSHAAPVQVAWLGFPGSSVGVDCDYIIGDPIVLPKTSALHYHEIFCRLPETYQPNDPTGRPVCAPASRAELGLPEGDFLFASFNHPRKITAEIITLWSRILHRVPRSKLWILHDSRRMAGNIASRFATLGIGTDRLIFTLPLPRPQHFARLPVADLILDTAPCNGHTTTADALHAGVPVLTMRGTNFASRVAESLLTAGGLPDLVAENGDDYVERAVALAMEPARCRRMSQRLIAERHRLPLFDSARFTRHLERAYRAMASRFSADLSPDHIDVEPIGFEEALSLVLATEAA